MPIINATDSEKSTIIAALRYYQVLVATGKAARGKQLAEIRDIATEGEGAPLSADEIDDLCERVNFGDHTTPEPAPTKEVGFFVTEALMERVNQMRSNYKFPPLTMTQARMAIEAKGSDGSTEQGYIDYLVGYVNR